MNDRTVWTDYFGGALLQNHALYEALELMRHPDYSFTQHLPKAKQHFLRSLIVKCAALGAFSLHKLHKLHSHTPKGSPMRMMLAT